MTKLFVAAVVIALASPFAAFADGATTQDIQQDRQAISADRNAIAAQERALGENDAQARELDRQRNEALRVKNYALASKLQAMVDQKHAARRAIEANLQKLERNEQAEKHEAREQCSENSACAAERRRKELLRALETAQRQLAFDEAAAGRVAQEKSRVEQLEAQLKQ